MIKALCDEYGKKIGTLNGISYHQFPTLGILLREKKLNDSRGNLTN